MPKCVLHGKGHGTHGQSELVRYNMQRTAAHGGAGPALTDGWERPLGRSVRERGLVCAAEHGDGGMHARTVREADATRDSGCDDASLTGCVFGMEAD